VLVIVGEKFLYLLYRRMPAVLNEAFRSPFDKMVGAKQMPDESGTADIRNPDRQDLDWGGLSGGPTQPFQQNYQVQAPAVPQATWGAPANGIYNTLPYPEQNQLYSKPISYHDPVHEMHNCDRLIGEIMSCRVCRQKLQRLLAAWNEDQVKDQEGGSSPSLPFPLMDLSPNLITNIIIGVALIFLLDRILRLRT
jgi:hypothetical protein